MKSSTVSFAPGTGGFFLGSISQYLLHGSPIIINPDGSCHNDQVLFWGKDRLILENTAEGLMHEMAEIKKHLPVQNTKVVVTHARNLHLLTERFDKTIYINFDEDDVPSIQKKFAHKSDDKQEFNYNNIKDESWPDYETFRSGKAPSYVYDEMNKHTSRMHANWCWIIPALQKEKNLLKIEYRSLYGDDPSWLSTLSRFLEVSTDGERFSHAIEKWSLYKNSQPT
jgi:hypothetical protein